MIALIGFVMGAMVVVMTVGWVCQRAVDNGGWADVFWSYGSGASCAAVALVPFEGRAAPTWRQWLIAALLVLWALRLGTYVAVRVSHGAQDLRYAMLRREWGHAFQKKMFALLVLQAPATALLSISVLLAVHSAGPHLRVADLAGAGLLAIAIAGEALADHQLKRFKARCSTAGKVCDVGLWRWSRHPNYFFELLGWFAYPVIAIVLSRPWSWLSLIAPLLMFCLLRCVTGVPPLEAAMLRSRGEAYRRYQARVSALLPLPPKR